MVAFCELCQSCLSDVDTEIQEQVSTDSSGSNKASIPARIPHSKEKLTSVISTLGNILSF